MWLLAGSSMSVNTSANLTLQWLASSLSPNSMATTSGSWWAGGEANGSLAPRMASPLVTSLYGIFASSTGAVPLNSMASSLSAPSTVSVGTGDSSEASTMASTFSGDTLFTTLSSLGAGISVINESSSSTMSSILNGASMSPDYEEQQDRNIYIMPLFTQIIWSFIFGSMIFVAAGGNIIVIWIVLTNKRMASDTKLLALVLRNHD